MKQKNSANIEYASKVNEHVLHVNTKHYNKALLKLHAFWLILSKYSFL